MAGWKRQVSEADLKATKTGVLAERRITAGVCPDEGRAVVQAEAYLRVVVARRVLAVEGVQLTMEVEEVVHLQAEVEVVERKAEIEEIADDNCRPAD